MSRIARSDKLLCVERQSVARYLRVSFCVSGLLFYIKMPRRRGLTNAQIEGLLNIYHLLDRIVEVSDLDDSSGESGDDDNVPPGGNDSSDSE